MNCLTYARVSTEKQAEKELSIPAQLQAMREYAERQGWVVLEEYGEPGASGRSAERPVLRQMLARCKGEPKVDVVLVHKIDRLARNVYDHATIKVLLKQHSIRLASVVENVDDSITGQLVENIMASIADFFSANLGEEVKKGMTAKIRRGEWPHQPPLGYQMAKTANGRTLAEAHPVMGPLMRQAFELYASGYYSLKQVAAELAPKGLLTRLGNRLAPSQMNLLLRNPFFSGRLAWKGQIYPGAHQPLVGQSVFDRVQRLLTAHSHRGSTRYASLEFWLKGIAYCGACGTKMTAERHKGHAYYRCLANAKGRHRCSAPFSNAERVHGTLKRVYQALALTDGAKRRLLEAADAEIRSRFSVDLRRQRDSAVMSRTRLLERQLKAAEAYTAGDLSRDAYLTLNERLVKELTGLDEQIRMMKVDPDAIALSVRRRVMVADSVWDLHTALGPTDRLGLSHAVFDRIDVMAGKITDAKVKQPVADLLDDQALHARGAEDGAGSDDTVGDYVAALIGSNALMMPN